MSYTPLSDAEIREIASEYYATRQAKTLPQQQPVITLVGGQPGAGKSAAAPLVRSELAVKGGYIHIDADRMRERISIGSSKPTSEETQADAGKLAGALRELASQGRRNIVEEGTFRKTDKAAQYIQSRQDRGYKVELLAVATSREESLLGIYQRHEQQHATGASNPRFVPVSYHDEAMQGFDATVARAAARLDRVRVVNRAGELLYDSNSKHNTQPNALEALAAGRKITDAKLASIAKAWAVVEAGATARGAAPAYLEAIASHGRHVKALQDARIHAHAMQQLDANQAALAKDTRYARHSGAELVKAAYYRGFHEKASSLEGRRENFKRFDASMADRSTLSKMPDVADLGDRAAQRQRDADGHEL